MMHPPSPLEPLLAGFHSSDILSKYSYTETSSNLNNLAIYFITQANALLFAGLI